MLRTSRDNMDHVEYYADRTGQTEEGKGGQVEGVDKTTR